MSEASDPSAFLIAEFNVLHGRIALLETARRHQISVYMAAVGAVTALVGGTYARASADWQHLGSVAGAVLTLAGLILIRQHLVVAVQIVVLYRRAGRIRCWFDDNHKGLRRYLPWIPGDDTPPFRDSATYSTFAPKDPIMTFGTAVSAGLFAFSLSDTLRAPLTLAVAVSAAVLALTYLALALAARRWTESLEAVTKEPYNIHFPYSTRIEFPDHRGHR
ncbi:hypothetical protein [Nocardia crassostreae]|uniref:hypothetical protein n=1 Tax=Nocardia crassostreae TaxID=53428 RepID=UPI000AD727E3|nr:hypothetical protein [Nocardia crassostreae]